GLAAPSDLGPLHETATVEYHRFPGHVEPQLGRLLQPPHGRGLVAHQALYCLGRTSTMMGAGLSRGSSSGDSDGRLSVRCRLPASAARPTKLIARVPTAHSRGRKHVVDPRPPPSTEAGGGTEGFLERE